MSHLRFTRRFRCCVALGACLALASAIRGEIITFGSDTSWNVFDSSNNPLGNAQFVVLNDTYPTRRPSGATNYGDEGVGLLADLSTIPSAYWIWAPGITGDTPNPAFATFSFSKQFELAETPSSGTISLAVDDYAEVYVNGMFVGSIGSVSDGTAAYAAQSELTTFDFTSSLVPGQNTILVLGENGPFGDSSSYRGDPASIVFGGSLTTVPEPSGLLLIAPAAPLFLRRHGRADDLLGRELERRLR